MTDRHVEMNARLIEVFEKDIYCEVDGYYVFGTDSGCLTAHQLRQLAYELDKKNKDWDEIVNHYHDNRKEVESNTTI